MNDELYHYGVKGMKWGIRRTPAQLGHDVSKRAKKVGSAVGSTLKKAGKSTVSAIKSHQEASKQRKAAKKDTKDLKKIRKKPLSEMSDDELRRTIQRMQLEQQYANLQPKKVSAGKKFVNDFVLQPASNAAKQYISGQLNKMVQEQLKDKDPLEKLRKEVSEQSLRKQQQELKDFFATSELSSQVKDLRLQKQQVDLYNNLANYRSQFKGYLPEKTS